MMISLNLRVMLYRHGIKLRNPPPLQMQISFRSNVITYFKPVISQYRLLVLIHIWMLVLTPFSYSLVDLRLLFKS